MFAVSYVCDIDMTEMWKKDFKTANIDVKKLVCHSSELCKIIVC